MADLRSYFKSLDLAAIEEFVTDRRQEDLHLDFITLNKAVFNKDDRKNLATALSGFANADGGILVWGVESRKDKEGKEGVDAASATKPIKNVKRALSKAESLTGQAVNPIVDGVLHNAVPEPGPAQSGFLVTYVPPSDAGPHMAKFGYDRYYKRCGDSFYRMEHFDIEDMFGRRRKPRLSLHIDIRHVGTSGPSSTSYTVHVVLGIQNDGRGIARFPFVELKISPPYGLSRYGLDRSGRTGLPKVATISRAGAPILFAGGADTVVHVDSVLEVTPVGAQIREEDLESLQNINDLNITYRIGAYDVAPVEGSKTVPAKEIVQVINRKTAS